ncbi:hypothetical protein BU17DRAFT_92250 [Hysterangium stoloniferum]|nr:hypothetical protein BU17DRAFT_92250 [Hysterangium stoloniferum]
MIGFSRGTYQVRVLAGMIDKVGLIYKGNEEQIPFAYELYADPKSDGTTRPSCRFLRPWKRRSSLLEPLNLAKRFKDTFSRKGVRVHFIGVWDTVSSIGIVRGRNLPGTVKLDHVCYFRHALALDERRVKFLPEYACGGVIVDEKSSEGQPQRPPHSDPTAPTPDTLSENHTLPKKRQQRQKIPHIKEVWFPGTHSDIGGGNIVNGNLDRRHPSFLWMSFEAVWAGLKLDRSNVAWNWDELGSMRESLTLPWQILEYLPMKQLSYQSADSVTWWPHRGRGRKIQPGQKVHVSLGYCVSPYLPKASLPEGKGTWSDYVSPCEREAEYDLPSRIEADKKDLFELDIFDGDATEHTMKMIESAADSTGGLHRLKIILKSYKGRKTLCSVDNAGDRLASLMPCFPFPSPLTLTVIHHLAYHPQSFDLSFDPRVYFLVADSDADSSTKCLLEIFSTCNEAFFKELLAYRQQSEVELDPFNSTQGDFRNWSPAALKGVLNNDAVRRHLMNAGIIQSVLCPLSDPTKRVRTLGIEFAARLAFDDEIRGRVDWEQCLAFLRDGLGDDDEEIRGSSWRSIAFVCANGTSTSVTWYWRLDGLGRSMSAGGVGGGRPFWQHRGVSGIRRNAFGCPG